MADGTPQDLFDHRDEVTIEQVVELRTCRYLSLAGEPKRAGGSAVEAGVVGSIISMFFQRRYQNVEQQPIAMAEPDNLDKQ